MIILHYSIINPLSHHLKFAIFIHHLHLFNHLVEDICYHLYHFVSLPNDLPKQLLSFQLNHLRLYHDLSNC